MAAEGNTPVGAGALPQASGRRAKGSLIKMGAVLGPETLQSIAAQVAQFIEANQIPFERGEPLAYFSRLSEVHFGLTLGSLTDAQARTSVLLKDLLGLWNI